KVVEIGDDVLREVLPELERIHKSPMSLEAKEEQEQLLVRSYVEIKFAQTLCSLQMYGDGLVDGVSREKALISTREIRKVIALSFKQLDFDENEKQIV
ncbi:hypothetical protein HK405_010474, partial [Cladochytrium tenue]